jgi:hypothetical protein
MTNLQRKLRFISLYCLSVEFGRTENLLDLLRKGAIYYDDGFIAATRNKMMIDS